MNYEKINRPEHSDAEPTPQNSENTAEEKKNAKVDRKTATAVFDKIMSAISSVLSVGLKVLGAIFAVLLLAGMIFACILAFYIKTCLTPELDVSLDDYKLNQSSTIWYTDSAGEQHELISLTGKENRVWVNYEDIPKYMEQAVVSIEDKRFYDHKGVDWYRTSGAFVEMFVTMQNSYGGSTVTQQLIKNLTGQDEVTVQRKLNEIFGALELEKKYDKKEIMEWYLNAVYFGEGAYGVQTAAHTYFNKDVKDLTLAECAAIAGITNMPTYYDPFYSEQNNKERQETILKEMYNQGFISYDEYKDAASQELVFSRSAEEETVQQVYTYYEEAVINEVIADLMEQKGLSESAARQLVFNGGYQIYSCFDPAIQACVDNVYTNMSQIPNLGGTQQLQSAIVIMNPYDGEILALSGGVGTKSINFGLNRATQTKRSPGSSFKPIASYGPATELGYITPTTWVNDAPNITLKGTNWYPKNDSNQNYGYVTILQALQYSLNTVAAQIVDKLGPETSYNFLINKLGMTSLTPADCDYAPMALGQLTNGITVREMAAAYCSFVNDGVYTYSRLYTLITDKEGNVVINNTPSNVQAFSANTAHVMTYLMENAVNNGTGSEAKFYGMPVAGKTGTSGEYNDRWFVGCTPYYVAAVWTGYDIPARVNTGGNPAAQLFRKVMQPVHEGLAYKSFVYPYIGENTEIFGITDADVIGDIKDIDELFPESETVINMNPATEFIPSGNTSYPGGNIVITG